MSIFLKNTQGIVNLRSNSPTGFMVVYAFRDDNTRFTFVWCFKKWVELLKVSNSTLQLK